MEAQIQPRRHIFLQGKCPLFLLMEMELAKFVAHAWIVRDMNFQENPSKGSRVTAEKAKCSSSKMLFMWKLTKAATMLLYLIQKYPRRGIYFWYKVWQTFFTIVYSVVLVSLRTQKSAYKISRKLVISFRYLKASTNTPHVFWFHNPSPFP